MISNEYISYKIFIVITVYSDKMINSINTEKVDTLN